MRKLFTTILIILIFNNISIAQEFYIKWKNNDCYSDKDGKEIEVLHFEEAQYSSDNHYIPFLSRYEEVSTTDLKISFIPQKVETISKDSIIDIAGFEQIPHDFAFDYNFSYMQKKPLLIHRLTPIRYNAEKQCYERIVSYRIDIVDETDYTKSSTVQATTSINSVLSVGEWHKFQVSEDGFYKITYSDLESMGINVGNLNPKTIKIYGNGGKMLPENNSEFRYDDLHEMPITVVGEEDGVFNTSDYILFYGDSPDEWKWNEDKDMYLFLRNLYSRHTCYFLTYGGNNGRRFEYQKTPTGEEVASVSTFVDYQAIEPSLYHLTKSGRQWFGDRFDTQTRYDYTFSFPDIVTTQDISIAYAVAARATASSLFTITSNDYEKTHSFRAVGSSLSSSYAFESSAYTTVTPINSNLTVTMRYSKPNSSAMAWMRFLYVNVHRQLKYNGGTLFFRYPTSTLNEEIAEFNITGSSKNFSLYNITDPAEPKLVKYTTSGNTSKFKDFTIDNQEYVCFDGTDTKTVTYIGKVANQNIHGLEIADMVIVYYRDFYNAADKLHNFHVNNGLKVHNICIDDIYNEFSSGMQDVCAIRDMMRYWYKNSDENNCPKYLLLVGDASYDPLDRLTNNTNFIPIYQSKETLSPSYSYCSDDFYGFLDDDEGSMGSYDLLDISVGRIPVQTAEQANQIVDKMIHYASNTKEQMGDWRNIITFSCDDADNTGVGYETRHFDAAEKYASIIEENHKEFHVNKIYSGAYQQVTAAGGQRYPEVNNAINARMEQGNLIFGYNGHGGELCLALEQIVSIPDINSWKNYDRQTFMVTATCEFSRYDDPARTSAGEMVLLNPNGGAFAMLTTCRLTDATSNLNFCSVLYANILEKIDGRYPTIGEFVMNTKNQYILKGHSFLNITPYVILGDPAMSINYPKLNSVEITDFLVDNVESDTIKALSTVNIKGRINDDNGNLLSDFNGIIYPEIRDKQMNVSTLGNDGAPIQYFSIDKSVIYKGKSVVKNGLFEFTFITPKDIAYKFGKAKANFYFSNDEYDGNGYYDEYSVGGSSDFSIEDTEGPVIKLYLNDTSFADGDITHENPTILASLYDESGINTTGNGIGHDIIATLDNDIEHTYVLNTYYENELGSYQKGYLSYPIFNLSEGEHSLQIRAWDVYNNSSTETLDFVVVKSDEIKLVDLINYPNPFSDETHFELKHNQASNKLDVELYIYSTNGQLVKFYTSTVSTDKFKDVVYTWNGKDNNGNNTTQGIYVYKVVIKNENGIENHISGKIIKL